MTVASSSIESWLDVKLECIGLSDALEAVLGRGLRVPVRPSNNPDTISGVKCAKLGTKVHLY